MHPGWADTSALRVAMPDFHKSNQATLRTPAQGADTIVWLASSPSVAQQSGNFYFDRAEVRQHMPWGGTTNTTLELQHFWDAVKQYIKMPNVDEVLRGVEAPEL